MKKARMVKPKMNKKTKMVKPKMNKKTKMMAKKKTPKMVGKKAAKPRMGMKKK